MDQQRESFHSLKQEINRITQQAMLDQAKFSASEWIRTHEDYLRRQ
jgi:hypothetical protein